MVDALISTVASSVGSVGGRVADNCVDRLNRFYGSVLLVSLACLATSKQLVGSPIECWCPAQFTDSQVRYTNSYCWVSNTHYLSNEQVIPYYFPKESTITYYQWVPLVFLVQSFLCHLPFLFWKFLLQLNGANVSGLIEASMMASKATHLEMREKAIAHIAAHLDRYTCTQRCSDTSCYPRIMNALSRRCFIFGGRNFGNFLANAYLLVKVAYVSNSVLQIYLLDLFLGGQKEYQFYGIRAVHGFLQQIHFPGPEHFPTITLCAVDIRDQSRIHSYVVQCVLSINIFYEKIFIFLWFWFVALIILTFTDFVRWLVFNFHWRGATSYVSKRLRCSKLGEKFHLDPILLSRFVRSYLRRDGMIIIRLIGCNYGDVLVGEILDRLWFCYIPRPSEGNYANMVLNHKKKETRTFIQESSSTTQLV